MDNPYPVYSSGARYDPTTDTWQPTSTGVDSPSKRWSFHTAVWTGSEMIVWGGSNDDGYEGGLMDTGGRSTIPPRDSWTRHVDWRQLPRLRPTHTAVWTGRGDDRLGGHTIYIRADRSGGRYDPVTDSWLPMSTAIARERYDHTAVWTALEMIVWGGFDSIRTGAELPTGTGGRYDPSTDAWDPTRDRTSRLPSPRSNHTRRSGPAAR